MKAWNICVTHAPAHAGLYRSISDFARALDAPILSFDEAAVASPPEPGCPRVERLRCGNWSLTRNCHILTSAAAARADIAVESADLLVVHSLFRAHNYWAKRNASRNKRHYWAVPHGCLDPWGLATRRYIKLAWLTIFGRDYFDAADRIIFSTRRELQKAACWVNEKRAAVVNWPVTIPSAADAERYRNSFREELAVSPAERILLYVGRLHTMKRPLHMVEAFCKARAAKCHLAIIGMPDNISLETLRATIPPDHTSRIHVLGARHGRQLEAAYRGSDGFLSLSHRENFGYAAAEAAAFGLPMILSPGHDLAHDMPTHKGQFAGGWLLPDDNVESAAEAIRLFDAAPTAHLDRIGAIGHKWAQDALSFSRFQAALRALAE